ncbi:MAG: phosphate acyltransferase PlsX, partial [Anaerolinea sp.]|nr:phosphate acyltransferase PlsX [Anaerolinea sp.]
MKIAVDAMGSDNHPQPDVEGAVLAAREYGDDIILVGDERQIQAQLALHRTDGLKISIVHAPQAVAMDDKPGVVVKSKPQSSMHMGLALVRDGAADAFVTAGNTGAALSIATLATLRRIPGIKRPALSALIGIGERNVIVLDVGANTDCKPEWLLQFAVMGKIYARSVLGMDNPRIALLANGEEAEKGSEVVQQTHRLLRTQPDINFVGNIEPKDMMKGSVDVIVCDGFVGNILLKSLEGATRLMVDLIRDELMRSALTKMGALLARPAFRRVARQIDPNER